MEIRAFEIISVALDFWFNLFAAHKFIKRNKTKSIPPPKLNESFIKAEIKLAGKIKSWRRTLVAKMQVTGTIIYRI